MSTLKESEEKAKKKLKKALQFDYPHIWANHPNYGMLKRDMSVRWGRFRIRYYDELGIARYRVASKSLDYVLKEATAWLEKECMPN